MPAPGPAFSLDGLGSRLDYEHCRFSESGGCRAGAGWSTPVGGSRGERSHSPGLLSITRKDVPNAKDVHRRKSRGRVSRKRKVVP